MKLYIIGCGGVGSWLAPSLCLLNRASNVTLVDGDLLEKKNLNRQLFTEQDIGKNKADALAEKYGCESMARYYSFGDVEHSRNDALLVCVDNHAGRRSALQACDRYGCSAIFAANETNSSEAYIYRPRWQGTRLDPRIYYPDIATDNANDPRARSAGCTGEAQESNPQLVTSNSMAASLASHLFVLWFLNVPKLDKSVVPYMPFRLRANLSKLESDQVGQL